MENVCGSVHAFGDNIDTEVIIPARYLNSSDPAELAKHCMEDIDADFTKKNKAGDLIVARKNFGCGSSREHALIAIKAAGVSCVIAETFARIFYRNAINIGLPVLVSKDLYEAVEAGQEAELDLSEGTIVANGTTYTCTKLPPYMQNILNQGGLIASLNREEN